MDPGILNPEELARMSCGDHLRSGTGLPGNHWAGYLPGYCSFRLGSVTVKPDPYSQHRGVPVPEDLNDSASCWISGLGQGYAGSRKSASHSAFKRSGYSARRAICQVATPLAAEFSHFQGKNYTMVPWPTNENYQAPSLDRERKHQSKICGRERIFYYPCLFAGERPTRPVQSLFSIQEKTTIQYAIADYRYEG